MLPNRTMLSDAEGAALAPDVSGLPSSADVLAARLAFPAGLEQPEGSFRFSADALLLAAYASRRFSPNVRLSSLFHTINNQSLPDCWKSSKKTFLSPF